MADLVDWYNAAEREGELSPSELASLFHYRYIRIHPFEDGNGRIARLMANYILARHGYPMIVVRSRKKQEYLEALHKTDLVVGSVPSDGAHASIKRIYHFLDYFQKLIASEINYDVDFVSLRGEHVWWFDGEQVKFRSPSTSKLLWTIMRLPSITTSDLSAALGINIAAVNKQLKRLTTLGYIVRNVKDGSWQTIITPSM